MISSCTQPQHICTHVWGAAGLRQYACMFSFLQWLSKAFKARLFSLFLGVSSTWERFTAHVTASREALASHGFQRRGVLLPWIQTQSYQSFLFHLQTAHCQHSRIIKLKRWSLTCELRWCVARDAPSFQNYTHASCCSVRKGTEETLKWLYVS